MTLFERLMRVVRQGVEWLPDRFYAHRHPGPAGRLAISLLAPVVVRLTPNDKWSLGVHLPFWLSALEAPPVHPLPAAKRIFLFCAYRIQFTHDFMTAILLAWRGHTITLGYLPKLQSPIKQKGRCTPNDKWSLGVHLPFWLSALEAPPVHPLPAAKRIFLFCAYRIQFTHDFMTAILLAWRGHTITLGYLPKLQSPIKQPLVDHPSAKPYLAAVLGKVGAWSRGRIRCVDLSDVPVEDVSVDEEHLRSQVLSDTIMCTRRETVDMADPDVAKTWIYYEEQARHSHAIARSYLSRNLTEFDVLVVANGTTFETAQFCQVSRSLGLPVNTFEKFDFRGKRVLNHGDHFLAFNDLDTVWTKRREIGYHDEPFRSFAVNRALTLLDERRRGSTANWGWVLQKSPKQTLGETLRVAGIEDGRRFVLVCTNVPYDAGYACLLGLFSSMREWLLETVKFLLDQSDVHVVVRAHPGEVLHFGGKERSEDTLAEFIGHERLTVIPGDEPANTYNLIERCQFGVVFSSTTGMEMAMLGKTAVIGATVYYGRRGFTVDSDNRDAYFAHLRRLAAAETVSALDEETSREAALFHFIFHLVMPVVDENTTNPSEALP